jgi:hypothetical protein
MPLCLYYTCVYLLLLILNTKVIIFLLENGKFEFSRKQYIFLKLARVNIQSMMHLWVCVCRKLDK